MLKRTLRKILKYQLHKNSPKSHIIISNFTLELCISSITRWIKEIFHMIKIKIAISKSIRISKPSIDQSKSEVILFCFVILKCYEVGRCWVIIEKNSTSKDLTIYRGKKNTKVLRVFVHEKILPIDKITFISMWKFCLLIGKTKLLPRSIRIDRDFSRLK